MTLHRTLLSLEFLYFCGTIATWRHRDAIVVDASLQKFAQHILPPAGTVHSCMVPYPSVALVNLELSLRENVPGISLLPCAGGYQLVHRPGSKCS